MEWADAGEGGESADLAQVETRSRLLRIITCWYSMMLQLHSFILQGANSMHIIHVHQGNICAYLSGFRIEQIHFDRNYPSEIDTDPKTYIELIFYLGLRGIFLIMITCVNLTQFKGSI